MQGPLSSFLTVVTSRKTTADGKNRQEIGYLWSILANLVNFLCSLVWSLVPSIGTSQLTYIYSPFSSFRPPLFPVNFRPKQKHGITLQPTLSSTCQHLQPVNDLKSKNSLLKK
jgi:hypothetical protein